MKKLLSLFTVLALLACAAFAEDTRSEVYSDDYYSFAYPASWSLDKADNGDIVLMSPDGNSGILTFCVFQNYITLTGDFVQDSAIISSWMENYSGPNLEMNGEYEYVEVAGLKGYRLFGSWKATGDTAQCVMLTGDTHLAGFVLIGETAIEISEALLGSIELRYDYLQGGAREGYLTWSNDQISVDYPDTFSLMDGHGRAVFRSQGTEQRLRGDCV